MRPLVEEKWLPLIGAVAGATCLWQAIRVFLPSVMFIGVLVPGMTHVRMAILVVAVLVLGALCAQLFARLPRRYGVLFALFAHAALLAAPAAFRLWLGGIAVALWMAALPSLWPGLGAAPALLLSLLLDRALSLAFGPSDFLWNRGPLVASGWIAIAAALIALSQRGAEAPRLGPGAGRLFAVAGALYLGLSFWLSPAALSARTALPPGLSAFLCLGTTGLAVGIAALPLLAKQARIVAGAVLVLASLSAEAFPLSSTVAGLLSLAPLLAAALLPRQSTTRAGLAVGLSGAVFVAVAMVALYFLSYSQPIPFPRPLWAAISAALLVGASWGAPQAAAEGLRPRPFFLAGIGIAVLATLGAFLGSRGRPLGREAGRYPVRVASHNIQMGFGADGWANLGAIAGEIERDEADVVLLQEVSRGSLLAGGWDTIGVIARRLGYHFAYFDVQGPLIGAAIASRFPIARSGVEWLPTPATSTRVAYVWAEVEMSGGERLRVANAHLEDDDDEASVTSRLAQLEALAAGACGGEARRCVVGGDLNSPAGRGETAPLERSGLRDAYLVAGGDPRAGLTAHAARPEARIDYLWVSADLAVRDFRTAESLASDHFLVSAAIEATGPGRTAPATPELDGKRAARTFQAVCAACHARESRTMGPSLREIQEKYRGRPEALAAFASRPHRVRPDFPPMPSQAYLGEEKLREVARYILTLD